MPIAQKAENRNSRWLALVLSLLCLVPTADWSQSLAASRSGAAHILAFLNQTPARDEWLIFTEPYFTDPAVFITREDHEFIVDPGRLVGETIVLPAGTSMEERIRASYPDMRTQATGRSDGRKP